MVTTPTAVAARLAEAGHTVIVCLFTGELKPAYLEPMTRDPQPPIGLAFDGSFVSIYREQLSQNPALHDGALLVGRATAKRSYRIDGWSMRLFPPPTAASLAANRGSAFASCLRMSAVSGVDGLILASQDEVLKFVAGEVVSRKIESF